MFRGEITVYRAHPLMGVRGDAAERPLYQKEDVLLSYSTRTLSGSGCMPSVTVDVGQKSAPLDADGDRARLARFEILGAHVDDWNYPGLDVTGFLAEWCAREDFSNQRMMSATAYVPEPDPMWIPTFVMVRFWPKVED